LVLELLDLTLSQVARKLGHFLKNI